MGNVASQHSQDAGRSDLFVLDHIRSSPHLQEKARHCQNYGVDEDSLLHKLAEACELTSETIVEVIKEFSPGLNALKAYPDGNQLTPLHVAVLHANKAFVIAMLQLGTDCGVKAIWEGNHFSAWRIAKALWLDEIYDIFKLYGSGEGNQMQESETGEDGMNRTQRQFKEYFEEEERRKEEEAKQEREEEERKKKLEELKAKETHLGLRPFLR